METISVIVPVKDEEHTIVSLVEKINQQFYGGDRDVSLKDIIIIDDGSVDGTWQAILEAVNRYSNVKGIRFRRNFGKAAALQEGILSTDADILITMDGDLQDDPKEISKFIDAINSGYDVVSGWKRVRYDPLGKTLPSKLFNKVTSAVTGIKLHDFNCGFKAYRREVFNGIRIYGELHRFIPALAHDLGFKVTELIVEHHPRRFGRSKYGIGRLLKGFLDLLTVILITRFNSRPGHLFGGIGALIGGLGVGMFFYLSSLWLVGYAIGERPLLIISAIFMIVGLQFVLFGMIAELIINLRWRGAGAQTILSITTAEVTPKDLRGDD